MIFMKGSAFVPSGHLMSRNHEMKMSQRSIGTLGAWEYKLSSAYKL